METTNGNDILRRSRRLRNVVPELHGLVGPERTPPKKKVDNNNVKKDLYSSSDDDEDSTDKDTSETENSDDGLKDFNGINDFFPSDGREKQTRQFTNPSKIGLSRLRVKATPLEPFTQNRKQSSSSFVSRRKVAFENLSGVKEPQCTRSSNIPLNGVRLPTSQVQSTASGGVINLFSRVWPFIFVSLIIIFYFCCCSYMTETKTGCNSSELKQKFPRQTPKLWNYVESSRSNFKPFVLLLLHDSHEDVASCLAKQIAQDVACHRTQNFSEPKILNGRNGRNGLNRNILMSIRQELEYSKSLVVLNVEDMDPGVAGFFHYILDVEDPWVHGGVYVLTLNIPNINSNSINAYASVRKFLMEKWAKHIEEDNIDPLITRFGNQEYVVKEDSNPCH